MKLRAVPRLFLASAALALMLSACKPADTASAAACRSDRVKAPGVRSNSTGRYFSLLRSRPSPVARMRRWSDAMARPSSGKDVAASPSRCASATSPAS